jgi:hypothetical protein
MSEYKKVLFKWAADYLEAGAIVTDVRFEHNDGYYYSELTFQNPYDEIRIDYIVNGYARSWTLEPEEMPFGQLITELFALAEKEDNVRKA